MIEKLNDINLPIKKDSVIGKIIVKNGNKNIKEAIIKEELHDFIEKKKPNIKEKMISLI